MLFLHDDRRIRIHTSDKWIRMAQKYVDPVDPEHCRYVKICTLTHLTHERGDVVEGGPAVGAPVLGC